MADDGELRLGQASTSNSDESQPTKCLCKIRPFEHLAKGVHSDAEMARWMDMYHWYLHTGIE